MNGTQIPNLPDVDAEPLLDGTRMAPLLRLRVPAVTRYTREEALDILAPGGWLEGIYGPIADAPLEWLQIVATNVNHEPVCAEFNR